MRPRSATRTRDVLGGLALAVWLAMAALSAFASAVIPNWSPPRFPPGFDVPPPPNGCVLEPEDSGPGLYVCRGTSADGLIGGALNYARDWVGHGPLLPLAVFVPAVVLFPFFWLSALPSGLALCLATDFLLRRFVRCWRAARAGLAIRGGGLVDGPLSARCARWRRTAGVRRCS